MQETTVKWCGCRDVKRLPKTCNKQRQSDGRRIDEITNKKWEKTTVKWKTHSKQATNNDERWRSEMTHTKWRGNQWWKKKWPKTSNKQRQSDKEAMRWNNKYKVIENNGEMKNALKASNKQQSERKNEIAHTKEEKTTAKWKSCQKHARNNGEVMWM